jgi:ribosomal protein S18 acetylase RimI-like enzyme
MPRNLSPHIRLLGPADQRLLRDLLDVFGSAYEDPAHYQSAQPTDEYLERLLARDTFVALVAQQDGAVIGGAAAYLLPKFERARHELYLYDIAVVEAHRRRGVATALITALGSVAHERGADVLYVQADIEDAPAVALYDRLGRRAEVLHFELPVSASDSGDGAHSVHSRGLIEAGASASGEQSR